MYTNREYSSHKTICFVTTISKTMEWFVVENARNLKNNGYDITLVCNMEKEFVDKYSSEFKCINIDIARGINPINVLKTIAKLKRIFKQHKFDLVQYATPNAAFCASIAAKRVGIKNRLYQQWGIRYAGSSGIKRLIFKTIEKITCKHSSIIRAQSTKNMQFAIDEHLCKKNKIDIVGIGGTIGVDFSVCESIDATLARQEFRDKYNIASDAFVFGFVGRINKDKGINELLEAFFNLKKSNNNNNCYLVLVGMNDTTNPIEKELFDAAERDKHIIFTGNVSNRHVYEIMHSFDTLVHPTYREGFGKVLQEALAMGIPVITTDVPGPSEVIENGISGKLVPAKDSKSLCDMMIHFMNNKDEIEKYANNGKIRAKKYFDRKIMLNNILKDINSILEEK